MNYQKMTIAELQAEQQRCESGLAECNSIEADLKSRLVHVKQELARRLKPAPEPRVSDHALFRYLERVYNLDLEAIREEILTDKAKEALRMGATGYMVNGIKFKAKDGVLVTVLN